MSSFRRIGIGLAFGFLVILWGRVPAQEVPLPGVEDPTVASILARNPSTPSAMTRAAKMLADLDRPDLAKQLLGKVLAADLDRGQLAGLEAELGSALFSELGTRRDLAPEGRRLAEAVLSAARAQREDPKRLEALVRRLGDPDEKARLAALDGLLKAGRQGVVPLVAALADPARAGEQDAIRGALRQFGVVALSPLLATLESSDFQLQKAVIGVLAEVDSPSVVPALLAPLASPSSPADLRAVAGAALVERIGRLPSRGEAVKILLDQARRDFQRPAEAGEESLGLVEVWVWDPEAKRPVRREMTARNARRWAIARRARWAYAIAPEDPEVRTLYAASLLEYAAYQNGRARPLERGPGSPADETARLGPEVVDMVLQYAIQTGHPAAATAAAEILGGIGEAGELLYRGSDPTPLVAATRHPDRRLRLAAVGAVLRLGPTEPFAGSNYVIEALAYFIATSGRPRALVADPSELEARRLAGYVAAFGLRVDTAATGRELLRLATSSPDYELALVAAGLQRPPPDRLLDQLRRDPRTARLPVGIVARSGQFSRAQHMAGRDRLAEAFARPHTQEAATDDLKRLAQLLGDDQVSYPERLNQASTALDWLAQLAASPHGIFSIQRVQPALLAVLYVPRLGPKAAEVLGTLGTPTSQQTLVDVASRVPLPLDLRRAAARAFSHSVRQYGLLLSSREVLRQYDRYNASERLDAGTQQVLSLILDAIEAPTRAGAERRL